MNANSVSQCDLARVERELKRDSYSAPWRETYASPFDFEATERVGPDTKELAASGLRRLMVRRDAERGVVEFYAAPVGVESAGYVIGIERRAGK